jgi:hypothetical protein
MRNSISNGMVAGAVAIVIAIAAQSALAQSGVTLRDIRVDVSPLRANSGEPTASWVQHDLSVQLARALAGRIATKGSTLSVRIDYLSLSSGTFVDCGSSRDVISGVATISGVQMPVQATRSYQAAPGDQTMIDQFNRERVSQLVAALVFWLSRDVNAG